MNRLGSAFLVLIAIGAFGRLVAAQDGLPVVSVSTREITPLGGQSLTLLVSDGVGAPVDGVRVELREDDTAHEAVILMAPAGWAVTRDDRWLEWRGDPVAGPLRIRLTLFDDRLADRVRVRLERGGDTFFDERVDVVALPALATMARPAGFLQLPAVVGPGETIEMKVLDPAFTPADGQWIIAGAMADALDDDRIRVRLPDDLQPGTPVRASYFDAWGVPLIDAIAVEEVEVVTATPPAAAPMITGCNAISFLGQSVCVCGDFPGTSGLALTIDGQAAEPLAVSRHVVHLRLPDALGTGPHVIAGDTAAGFAAGSTATTHTVALAASIDATALMRGQSTTVRLALDGAPEPQTLSIVNRTPGVITLPDGNYQEVLVAADLDNPLAVDVDAVSVGDFSIDIALAEPTCPCLAEAAEHSSNASRPVPAYVPRRVLATIAAGTPAALMATAQAVADANGLSVLEIAPLALTADALAIFEILDGVLPPAKAAALAADPNVTGTQPDYIYDSYQGAADEAIDPITYPQRMIGADVVHASARGDGVRIAIVDAGIDGEHPRLDGRLVEYSDVTGTGWTPDVHGTLVAGVIAAGEGAGMAPGGVAPDARLVGVKACVPLSRLQAAARCFSSTLARGIDRAASRGVRVMNVSVGGPADALLTRMVDAAVTRGIVVVSAAGNDGPEGRPAYPAAIDRAIAVTAVDAAGQVYRQATRGAFIDLAAPGVDIMSTGPGGRDQLFSGTSAATALASGAVALLLQRQDLSVDELRALLRTTARDLGSVGPDVDFGDGLIDVCRAMAEVLGGEVACRP